MSYNINEVQHMQAEVA